MNNFVLKLIEFLFQDKKEGLERSTVLVKLQIKNRVRLANSP